MRRAVDRLFRFAGAWPRPALALVLGVAALDPLSAQVLAVTPSGKLPVALSRAELRACMQRQDDMAARQASLPGRTASYEAESRALEELAEARAKLHDRSTGEAVEAFNRATSDYNLRVYAHQATRKEIERDIARDDEDRAQFNSGCAGRPVYPADKAAVEKERAQAGGAAR